MMRITSLSKSYIVDINWCDTMRHLASKAKRIEEYTNPCAGLGKTKFSRTSYEGVQNMEVYQKLGVVSFLLASLHSTDYFLFA